MSGMNIKKGDKVKVLSGKDKGKEGVVLRALPQKERVVVEKNVAKRVAKSHKIRTDTGIELTFPAEYGENSDFIEFFSTPDGRIEIALKNIGAIENR